MGKERIFRFKHFEVSHAQSAIPVGMDGVLLGAWTDVSSKLNILDVGTGCGVIALMCAQRCAEAQITGIDIHTQSVEEAQRNFAVSAWSDRLHAVRADFITLPVEHKYDLIISNPPFFDAGIQTINASPRLTARHCGVLGPAQLLTHGYNLLSDNGNIALISPASQKEILICSCLQCGLTVKRLCYVISRPGKEPKRILIQVEKTNITPPASLPIFQESTLYIYDNSGAYTPEYKSLTQDFYLKF